MWQLLTGPDPCSAGGAQEYLQRYFYLLFSPQGLSLKVMRPQQPLEPPPLSEGDHSRLFALFAGAS